MKTDQVLNESDSYGVVIATQQHTKCFGYELYTLGDSVVLTTARPVLGGRQVRRCTCKYFTVVLSGP